MTEVVTHVDASGPLDGHELIGGDVTDAIAPGALAGEPGGNAGHAIAPGALAAEPGGNASHAIAPGALAAEPGGNASHAIAPEAGSGEARATFAVRLENFEGPFDLLLGLISQHKLDITEIALSRVTDDFIAHIKAMGPSWDLDQMSDFLVVAATLLDLKAARLLPQGEVEDPEDLALLEARDLLFARLLQYRAFKQVAAMMQRRLTDESGRHPRQVTMEPRFADLLPEVLIGIGPDDLARMAGVALAPKPLEELSLAHLHASAVTVREQAGVVLERLRVDHEVTFRALVADSPDTVTTVCRFLALLELFRSGAVSFEQQEALAELTVRWTGGEVSTDDITDEFDRPPDQPDEDPAEGQADQDERADQPGDTEDSADLPQPVPDEAEDAT